MSILQIKMSGHKCICDYAPNLSSCFFVTPTCFVTFFIAYLFAIDASLFLSTSHVSVVLAFFLQPFVKKNE